VPVSAFSFLGSWTFRQLQLGFPLALINVGDQSTNRFLQFGLGSLFPDVNGVPMASSSLTATRDFRITNPSEALTINQSYGTLFRGSNFNVTVRISRIVDSTPVFDFNRTERAGLRYSRLAGATTNDSLNLGAGDYRVRVRVRYHRNRAGLWDASVPTVGSAYALTFAGM